MDSGRLVGAVISRLRDQRLLFALGGIVIVATLAPFHLTASMGILGPALIIVILDRTFEFFGTRADLDRDRSSGFAMLVAPELEGVREGAFVQLVERAEYTIQDPGSPRQTDPGEVILQEGPGESGWLCPIPAEAGVNQMVSFTLKSTDGRQWRLNVVPGLSWPRKAARRIS